MTGAITIERGTHHDGNNFTHVREHTTLRAADKYAQSQLKNSEIGRVCVYELTNDYRGLGVEGTHSPNLASYLPKRSASK